MRPAIEKPDLDAFSSCPPKSIKVINIKKAEKPVKPSNGNAFIGAYIALIGLHANRFFWFYGFMGVQGFLPCWAGFL